jgi:lysozyme family protein
MEIISQYIEFVKRWEGGLSKDTADSAAKYPCPTPYKGKSGYHTNVGITYKVWVSMFGKGNDKRFFLMNDEDWFAIWNRLYFEPMQADQINSMSVAIFMVGMAWGSGMRQAVISTQKVVNQIGQAKVEVDGVIGPRTIQAINETNENDMFSGLIEERGRFFKAIAKGKNAKFLKGWLRRLESYRVTFNPKNYQ